MRKKMLSFALALALCLGLPVPAMAADYTEVIPCKYDNVKDFSEGLAAVCVDGKWGFIDKTGKVVIPCIYNNVNSFSEGLASVSIGIGGNGKWGFIDKTGKEVIPCTYDEAGSFSEGLVWVGVQDGRGKDSIGYYFCVRGYIDRTGKEVIPLQYETAGPFTDGLAVVNSGNRKAGEWYYGVIDKAGNEIMPGIYRYAHNFSEGLAVVRDANDWSRGYIDQTGKEVIPCQYTEAGDFSEGLAAVYVGDFPGGRIGFIDQTGRMVLPAKYGDGGSTALPSFSEGLAGVMAEGQYYTQGYIDKTGQVVIPFEYREARPFSEGVAAVAIGPTIVNSKFGYIDKTGTLIVPAKYDEARAFSEGMAAVAVKGESSGAKTLKWGFISLGGAQPTVPTVGNFTDVKTSDYFADSVAWAVEKGITSGTSATTFSPNQNCSVAQILTFLWRANGSPKPTTANPFTDVKSGDYYADAAVWAYEKDMVSGSTFGGNTPCTRSMAVAYMWKAAGSPSAKSARFTDIPDGAEYASAVAWAVEQGITSGTSATTFSPSATCTRAQIATFLYRGLAK